MISHALFPTYVSQFQYDNIDEFEILFYDNIFKYMNEDGFSNEFTGHVNIHHEENFKNLFSFVTQCLKQHILQMKIDPNLYDLNIIKTWMNITKDRQTPVHSHADAHYSFTYYINVPKEITKPLRFWDRMPPPNDGYYGMTRFNTIEWNQYNSYTWQFEPNRGDIFLFPASLNHDTAGKYLGEEKGCKTVEELKQHRICLAGDFLLTYKKTAAKPSGIQPVYNWRTFE